MSSRENSIPGEKSKVNLDKLLVEEIGQCGKFQRRIIVQTLITAIFVSCNINEYVFTTGRIETRCLIPECESTTTAEFLPDWITNAVPTSAGSLDNCHRYGNTSYGADVANDTCPATLFDTSVLSRCDHYVYSNKETAVYDFDLACDEWRRSVVGSVRNLAMMVALPLTGLVSDRWGRRVALAVTVACAATFGLARYWASSYLVYVLLMTFESVFGLGSYTTAYVLTVELLGPKFRVMGGAMMNTFFAFGQVVLALMAWIAPTWRELILLQYVPQFLMICFFWTLTESVRWMISKGRFEESETLLKTAARVNGRVLSQKSLDGLWTSILDEMNRKEKDKSVPLIVILSKYRPLALRCMVTSTWWMTNTFIFYGLSINSTQLMNDKYLAYALVALVGIPGYWVAVLFMDRFGRKPTIIATYWICAACQVAFIFISNGALSTVMYFLGKLCISVAVTTMNIYILELYPTKCRHRFYAFSSMVGRVGSIVAPLTPALGVTFFPELPFIMFTGMALVSGLLGFLVPETLGKTLPDTLREAFPTKN